MSSEGSLGWKMGHQDHKREHQEMRSEVDESGPYDTTATAFDHLRCCDFFPSVLELKATNFEAIAKGSMVDLANFTIGNYKFANSVENRRQKAL